LRRVKSDNQHICEKKRQRKEKKAPGPRQQKHRNRARGFSKLAETELSKMHRNVPQTINDKCKRLNQCSRCGHDGDYWANSASAAPIVVSSHIMRKRCAGEAGHEATQVPKSRSREAAP